MTKTQQNISKKKRLLLLAYHFPPVDVIGAVRPWHMARQLSSLGWAVTVLTQNPSPDIKKEMAERVEIECREAGIHRIFAGRSHGRSSLPKITKEPLAWFSYLPYRLMGRLLRLLGMRIDDLWLWPSSRVGAKFKRGQFDIVMATGCPFCSFISARKAAKRIGCPYVLDYRDPWTLNPIWSPGLSGMTYKLERRIIKSSSMSTIVSRSFALEQAESFRMQKEPLVITNGFDSNDYERVIPEKFEEFSLVYAGSFYPGQREIDPVFKAIRIAADKNVDSFEIKFHYFGSESDYVLERAGVYGVEVYVVCHGRVSRDETLSAIKGASIAVVIAGTRPCSGLAEKGIVTGKIFEPLGMATPILLVAQEESDARDIVDSSSAGECFTEGESEKMAAWLLDMMCGKQKVEYSPPEKYSWKALAGKLDKALRNCISEYDSF